MEPANNVDLSVKLALAWINAMNVLIRIILELELNVNALLVISSILKTNVKFVNNTVELVLVGIVVILV